MTYHMYVLRSSSPLLAIYVPLRTRFAAAAKIPDFSIRDLHFPEPGRTHSILCALVNYIKFSEQCTPFVMSLREKSSALNKDRDNVSNELREAQRKLDHIK